MDIVFRIISENDFEFLKDMLYLAIYVPEGVEPFPIEIIENPEISKYIDNWGRKDDFGIIAIDKNVNKKVGLIWIRTFPEEIKSYGFINEETPELSMSVIPEYRGKGIGTKMIEKLFEEIKNKYKQISLSVSKENPAKRLYERFSFEKHCETNDSITMLRKIKAI
ncbi:MAG: GNAT family N-acetyltransferase [Bacteroidetes bacterium]|nr:GNAT family N-acetyltransferase [Bacteroidota bacterium]MBU1116676.1 GNAT family N-acetyltransferase [Bacteroidota bacterium]MBU1798760.1 GNAT family N-acetyltransferase [Bacteroidota bacterium]